MAASFHDSSELLASNPRAMSRAERSRTWFESSSALHTRRWWHAKSPRRVLTKTVPERIFHDFPCTVRQCQPYFHNLPVSMKTCKLSKEATLRKLLKTRIQKAWVWPDPSRNKSRFCFWKQCTHRIVHIAWCHSPSPHPKLAGSLWPLWPFWRQRQTRAHQDE